MVNSFEINAFCDLEFGLYIKVDDKLMDYK